MGKNREPEVWEFDYSSFLGEDGEVDYGRVPVDPDEDVEGYQAWVVIVAALVSIETQSDGYTGKLRGIAYSTPFMVERVAKDTTKAWARKIMAELDDREKSFAGTVRIKGYSLAR